MRKHAIKGGEGSMWNDAEKTALEEAIADPSKLIAKREGNNA